MNSQLSTAGFDYAALAADLAEEARAIADRVRSRQRGVMNSILETGRDLLAIKERLGHGHFISWIDAEFAMTDRTAQNYMNAWASFGDKSEIVADLPPTVVYVLAAPSTPEPVVNSVFAKYEAGEKIEPSIVRAMVREAKGSNRQAIRDARMSADRKRQLKNQQRRIEKAEAERRERLERERAAANTVVTFLRQRLATDFEAFMELMSHTDAYRLAEALKAEIQAQERGSK